MAEIVRANIPVRNGVIHLIHRPLMIVDTTVMQFLEVSLNHWNITCDNRHHKNVIRFVR